MLTQIINARILTPQGWLKDGSVLIRDHKILEVTNCDLAVIGAKLIDAKGMYIVPGGVEIHVHGGGGRDFILPQRMAVWEQKAMLWMLSERMLWKRT